MISGSTEEIARGNYSGAQPKYNDSRSNKCITHQDLFKSHMPYSPLYLDATQRRNADINYAERQRVVEIPYYLRSDYGKSDSRELTMPARGYENYQRRPRSRSLDIRLRNKLSSHNRISEGRMRSVSQERTQSQAHRSFLNPIDIVWNPSLPRDATVHLELDVEDDIESQLEEFSFFVRLGHFKEAEEHFQKHLIDHIGLEPVLLEYTDMLLERGNYTKDASHEIPPPGSGGPVPAQNYGTKSRHYVLNNSNASLGRPNKMVNEFGTSATPLPDHATRIGISVYLRSAYREFHSMGLFKKGLKTAEWDELSTYMNARKTDRQPCSSDLQILQYYLKVLSHMRDRSNFTPPRMYFNIWSDRPDLYMSLLSDGRIWDVRDIILASVPALGGEHTWRTFIGADLHSSGFFTAFLRDWSLDEYDASSYLAALDILVTLAKGCVSPHHASINQQSIKDAERMLDHARRFSTCIKDNNPEYIKSRPYLRWILTEAEVERHSAGLKNDATSLQARFKRFPGISMWLSALPIYIPIGSENPGWHASTLQSNTTDLLQTGLEAAQDLGDYNMEASFLRELACCTEDPKELLTKLGNLQKLTQGDIVGYLQTCLTKYVLAHDEAQLQTLRDELADFEGQLSSPPSFARILEDPLMEWCKRMIQSALFLNLEQFTVQLKGAQDAAAAAAVNLPHSVTGFLSNVANRISLSLHQGHSSEDSELEKDRKELQTYRLNARRDEAAKIIAKYDEEGKQATEMEDKEAQYLFRLSHDLNISGISKKKAAALLEWVQNPDLQNSTRMSRKDVSLRALKRYNFDYEFDKAASNRVIIKRPLLYYEKDFLTERTKVIRGTGRQRGSLFGNNTKQENRKTRDEDKVTLLDSPPYSAASDSDSMSSTSLDLERGRRFIELPREQMSLQGQRITASPLIVTASPIHPELLEQGYKESDTKQTIIQNEKDDGQQVEGIDDGPLVEEVNDRPQVEEINDRPEVEEINDRPEVEEINDISQVEDINDTPQVEIVDPQTHYKNDTTDDSGNTKNTDSNSHNEAKGSEQYPKIEPPQRRATFAYVESSNEDK